MPNRLKNLRERRQITQAELARMVKVSRQALSAIESNRQEPSLPLALKVAQALNIPVEAIFFGEELLMEVTSKRSLTKIERLALVNQYKLLQVLHADDEYLAKHYKRLEQIFENGYVHLYDEALGRLSDELSETVSDEALAILDMHRAMLFSLGDTPDQAYVEKVRFKGFDANNEGEYLSFAKFFQNHPDSPKFEELRIFNSHHSTLPRYRLMLAEWRRMKCETHLNKEQIDSILDAGTFQH